jgi:hypothetical protein
MIDAMKILVTATILGGLVLEGPPAHAGPTDTPLPTFSDGKASVAVYTMVGVIKGANLETDVLCTNVDTVAVDIGVEVFDETGALRNSVNGGSGAFLNVSPGKTVTAGTAATVAFHEDETLTLNSAGNGTAALRNGSGRVVGTSKNLLCTAFVLDKVHAIADPATCSTCPPPPFSAIPLIKVP